LDEKVTFLSKRIILTDFMRMQKLESICLYVKSREIIGNYAIHILHPVLLNIRFRVKVFYVKSEGYNH